MKTQTDTSGKGLHVNIYKHAYRSKIEDCSNGGISADREGAILVNVGSPIFDPTDEYPALVLKSRNIFGDDYWYVEPANNPTGKSFMFGGTFVYTSDSRFPSKYPLPLHDRQE